MVDVKRFSSREGGVRIILREKWVYLMPVLLIVCLCLAVSSAGAAYTTPSKVPIQGRLTNVSTGVALSGPYNFTFRIYNASTDGTKLWEENQSLVLDSGGLWSTYLGNNTPLDFSFSEDMYIEMEINHDSDPLPRVQLATVPYSKRTDIAANLSCVDCIGGVEINESTLSDVNAAQLSGQASGYYLNMSTPFGGDLAGAYNALKVNASKIDTGILNRSYIEDAYLLNTGDNASGNYSFDSGGLYVDSSNHRIGIGTSTPAVKLDVQGGVNAAVNLTTPLVCLNGDCRTTWPTGSGISSAGGWVNTSSETYSSLDVNLSNKFFFNSSSGYVGIGTTTPGEKAHIYLDANTPHTLKLQNPNTGTSAGAGLGLWSSAADGYLMIFNPTSSPWGAHFADRLMLLGGSGTSGVDIVSSVDDIRFYSGGYGTANERMRILSGGNVGIGTMVPGTNGTKLEVKKANIGGPSTFLNNPMLTLDYAVGWANDELGGIAFLRTGETHFKAGISSRHSTPSGDAGALTFYTNNDSINNDPTIKMLISGSGNVGIGTTSPLEKLHVVAGNGAGLRVESTGNNPVVDLYQTGLNNAAARNWRLATNADNWGDFGIFVSSANNTAPPLTGAKLVILSNGNVGIGTIGPLSKLDVEFPNVVLDNGGGYGAAYFGTTDAAAIDKGASLLLGGSAGAGVNSRIVFGSIAARKENVVADNLAGYLQFATNSPSGTVQEFMRISSGGNVGIGTTSPNAKLDIDAGTGFGSMRLNGTSGGCMMLRDTDNAGWTKCTALNGVLTCAIDADGVC
jgi:hypothetical protein